MSHHPTARLPTAERRRARLVVAAVLLPALVATVAGLVALWPAGPMPSLSTAGPGQTFATARVVDVEGASVEQPQVVAELGDGTAASVNVPPEYLGQLAPGDRIEVVELAGVPEGFSPYVFVDFDRSLPLGALAAVFAVLVVLVARWRGLASLLGLGVAMAVIGGFTLPALLDGRPAVPVALVSSSAIMFVVLYLAHGFSLRTSTALLGTLAGLGVTAGLAAWATDAARLTGLSGEYSLDLLSYAPRLTLTDVLLCGMVLAGLGVLNDVTITQASAVWELHAGAPGAPRRTVFARAMRIGRDHIASTVYTMVFAYVGAALPLILLVAMSDRAMLDALTNGELAEEVARTLVGSIGLVLAIPLTTALAVLVVRAAEAGAGAAQPPRPTSPPSAADTPSPASVQASIEPTRSPRYLTRDDAGPSNRGAGAHRMVSTRWPRVVGRSRVSVVMGALLGAGVPKGAGVAGYHQYRHGAPRA